MHISIGLDKAYHVVLKVLCLLCFENKCALIVKIADMNVTGNYIVNCSVSSILNQI